jgi:hypothetical protein
LFKPNSKKIPKIVSRLGLDYSERVLPSIGREVLTSIVVRSLWTTESETFLLTFFGFSLLLHRHNSMQVNSSHREKQFRDSFLLPFFLLLRISYLSLTDFCLQVSRHIREGLTKRAEEFDILLDDVSIVDLTFSPEFVSAIEAKQVGKMLTQLHVSYEFGNSSIHSL